MRFAIEDSPKWLRSGLLDGFPSMCCRPASQLLARYLLTVARAPMVHFVSGRRHGQPWCRGGGWQTHVWIEAAGLTVDITGDQYEEAPASVIVAERSEWHETFQVRRPMTYSETMQMEGLEARRFEKVYQELLATMRQPRPRPSHSRYHGGGVVAAEAGGHYTHAAARSMPGSVTSLGAVLFGRRGPVTGR
jgi:hypothetical protein